jgi:hypothetical protein
MGKIIWENVPRKCKTMIKGVTSCSASALQNRSRRPFEAAPDRALEESRPSTMKRSPPANRQDAPALQVQPSAEHAQLALREAERLMRPLAQWLLRHGVPYPEFAELLKSVFLEAARSELARSEAKPTQSALSMLSGVHRKDVRALEQAPEAARTPITARPSLASQVLTYWLTERRYRAANGKPLALPRVGLKRSFESLCRELSSDLHPRTVLDELLRLGQVMLDGENVVVIASSFVPSSRLDEMSALFSANVADHIAAAVSNLTTTAPRFLEQSVYADGLTQESIDRLHDTARQCWARALESIVTEARDRVGKDSTSNGELRMRFGAFFYSEPARAAAMPQDAGTGKPSPPRRRARNRDKE